MRQSNQYNSQMVKKLRRTEHLSQYLSNLNQQRKSIQLYELMSSQTNLTYIDQQKKFAIVKTSYINELKQQDSKLKKQLDDIQKQIKQQHNRKAAFNRLIQLKDEQIDKLKQNLKLAYKKIQQLDKNLQNNQQVFTQKQKQLKLLFEKYQDEFKQQNKRKSQNQKNIFSNKQQTATQTYYDADINIIKNKYMNNNDLYGDPDRNNNNMKKTVNEESISVKIFEEQISKLKQNFEKVIQEISNTAQKKLKQIQQQKQILKQWAQQNRRLKQQNEQLMKQIKYINQQQQRIRIWKQTLQQFVENVQKQYQADHHHIHHSVNIHEMHDENINTNNGNENERISKAQYSNYLKDEKIKYLQSAIDKMQAFQKQKEKRLVQIKQMLDDVDSAQISQENIVNNLLTLSAKIKQVIRYLLEQL